MRLSKIPQSSLSFSRLGLGSLTVSQAQSYRPPEALPPLFQAAYDAGITWLDTAQQYENYQQLAPGLAAVPEMQVVSKTYAASKEEAKAAIEEARQQLNRDVIEVFMLHEQESKGTLNGHLEAFEALVEAREQGLIHAVGVSTHAKAVVDALRLAREGDPSDWPIDPLYQEAQILFALCNPTGIGLLDASAEAMAAALKAAHDAGLFIMGMKLYAGGHLLARRDDALRYALAADFVDVWCVGMKSLDEITINSQAFLGQPRDPEAWERSAKVPRQLKISDWCIGCGACLPHCKSKALWLENGTLKHDPSLCTLCSYCAHACRDFAIKII